MAWGCDCDGVKRSPNVGQIENGGLAGHLVVIEKLTRAPRVQTCPWRSYYSPLVREVMALAWSVPEGNLSALVDDRTPAIVLDALAVFQGAMQSVLAEEARLRDEARKR